MSIHECKLYKDSNDEALVGDVILLRPSNSRAHSAHVVTKLDGRGYCRVDTDSAHELKVDPYPHRVSECTLIRRGETAKAVRVPWSKTPVHASDVCVRCLGSHTAGHEAYCEYVAEGEPVKKPAFLGHDRNGREVRRGNYVAVVLGGEVKRVVHAMGITDGCFTGENGELLGDSSIVERWSKKAELVDEKVERCDRHDIRREPDGNCTACQYDASRPPGLAAMVENMSKGDWVTHDPKVGSALESFARWLAEPTLSERFEAFRARVHEELGACSLTLTFDCDQRRGPHVLVEHPDIEPWVCGESYTHAAFSEFIADMERKLGRKALSR